MCDLKMCETRVDNCCLLLTGAYTVCVQPEIGVALAEGVLENQRREKKTVKRKKMTEEREER